MAYESSSLKLPAFWGSRRLRRKTLIFYKVSNVHTQYNITLCHTVLESAEIFPWQWNKYLRLITFTIRLNYLCGCRCKHYKVYPHTFIFPDKKMHLQNILFAVYLQLVLEVETNQEGKNTVSWQYGTARPTQLFLSVFDMRSKTGVIFLLFPSHCSLSLATFGWAREGVPWTWDQGLLSLNSPRETGAHPKGEA
jgi:hypothetical protein